MERQPERSLAYYLAADDDPDNWVPLYFITTDENGRSYFGFESVELTDTDIQQRLNAGELVRFGAQWTITPTQELWKAPYGDVWLTTGSNPIEDPNRILVKKGDGPQFLSKHEIIFRRAERHLLYIPDEYVDSPVYTKFAGAVAENVAKQLNVSVRPQKGIVARWDMLDSIIDEGAVDFTGLAYFLHPARASTDAVVQFATLDTFTLYFDADEDSISYDANPLLNPELSVHERILKGLDDNGKLEFGVLDRTAATLEMFRIFREQGLKWIGERGLKVESNVGTLKEWLTESPAHRVIICDHNFADELDLVGVSRFKPLRSEHNSKITKLPFREPLPVGFVYPRRDQRWGHVLRSATATAVSKLMSSNGKYDTLRKELKKKLQATLLTKDELRASLGLPADVIDQRVFA